ncbi:MAG: hypothetical protein K8U57_15795 [Planctomycetes bacterium]|nr:hypothetical protein [Planctomycetota bacterium]
MSLPKNMPIPSDNETWVIETGDVIIQKKARDGLESLTPWEHLVYCLWVADYGMRNAGDLDSAADVYAKYHSEGRRLSITLSLQLTNAAFKLSKAKLEQEYFERFKAMCDELRGAEPN